MSIDIERLKVDESLWPEGATHYSFWVEEFFKLENGEFWVDNNGIEWVQAFIPRPTSPEWVNGLPPVGCECEINPHGEWFKATVHGYGKNKFLAEISPFQKDSDGDVINGEHAYWTESTKFRPIRTPEEKQREELAGLVYSALDKNIYMEDCEAVIEAILSKYNLTEK